MAYKPFAVEHWRGPILPELPALSQDFGMPAKLVWHARPWLTATMLGNVLRWVIRARRVRSRQPAAPLQSISLAQGVVPHA